jgi:hypothetical protein
MRTETRQAVEAIICKKGSISGVVYALSTCREVDKSFSEL